MPSKSSLSSHNGVFLIILLLSMLLSLFYMQGCAKQESKTVITVVDKDSLSVHFDGIEEVCIDTLNFGNEIYHITSTKDGTQVRFRIVAFSDGERNTIFESDLLNTAEKGSYFSISINDGVLYVSQFGNESPAVVVEYNLNYIPVESYKTSSFSWLNKDMEVEGEIACFQFYGSMTDTLSTIDINLLEPSEFIGAKLNGFVVTIETV